MQIIGGAKMHVYPAADEYPHEPGTHENWQESFVLHFFDIKGHLGAYLRLGHEPNYNGGEFNQFCNIVSPDGIWHRIEATPIKAGDVTQNSVSAKAGALRYAFDGNRVHWQIREPGVEADLVLHDFHAAIDGYPKTGAVSEYAPQHVEVAVRVTGTITTQGNTYDVDGIGIRDHGWGIRTWDAMVSHRWTVGVFDKDNSFCALTIHTTDDYYAKFGWVVRGDTVIYAENVDIVTYTEADGVSNRGGVTRMNLTTGEVFEATFKPLTPCVTSWIHGTLLVDNFCEVHWGDKIGVGDFESNSNMMRGAHRPLKFDAGTVDTNGWHPYPTSRT
jgi:hypothetical protein